MVLIQEGKAGVPQGVPIFPIKRHCRIKTSGVYKVRWCVLGNLDKYNGETYAPTASKKIVWLVFALAIILGLFRAFLDITGAFMAERPTRDIYVEIDGDVYLLYYSLYGLKDAPKLFNDGLVDHLTKGGHTQSKWDRCLFFKWESRWSFIIVVFHVDDFFAVGTSPGLLDEFYNHLSVKYDVTRNKEGVFLGIFMEPHGVDAYIFRKPHQLQNIFDLYLPTGPTMSLPEDPMRTAYSKTFDVDDSPPCETTDFRSVIGALMQLTDVRPDIAFALSKIAQRQCSPRVKDREALQYVIHYFWATRQKRLVLRWGESASAKTLVKLRGYRTAVSHVMGMENCSTHFALILSQKRITRSCIP